jgi:hypothetical protein
LAQVIAIWPWLDTGQKARILAIAREELATAA